MAIIIAIIIIIIIFMIITIRVLALEALLVKFASSMAH